METKSRTISVQANNDTDINQQPTRAQAQYRGMSASTKAAYLAKTSEYLRERYCRMSPAKKAAKIARRSEKQGQRVDAMSPAERESYNARKLASSRNKYRAMSPTTKAVYCIRSADRSHKRLVLKKLRDSQAYKDADPARRQQMEEMIVKIAMEQRMAKRALTAVKEPAKPELIQEKAPELRSRGEEIAASVISSFGQRVLEEIRQRERESRECMNKGRRRRKSD